MNESTPAIRGRRICIGDLQGCFAELEDLLEAVKFDPASDQVYCVGDLINRGPESARVLRRLIELDAVVVLGNHELHYLEILAGRRQRSGSDTMEDLLGAGDRDELTAWLTSRSLLHLEDDLVMVHAALSPAWSDLEAQRDVLNVRFRELVAADLELEDPVIRFAVSGRFCDAQGNVPTPGVCDPFLKNDLPAPWHPWDQFYTGNRRVVFGHWAQRGLVEGDRVRGLDSGCVYGNKLSAWIVEEDRIVQVPARKAYCRTETVHGDRR